MESDRRFLPAVKFPSLDFLRLRPYGDRLATPAVTVWLGFAWVIILLMASIEGIVWGLVGASIVPQATAWLRPIAGLFMFVLMFAIIWIVDASLIMSERPVRAGRGRRAIDPDQRGAGMRWFFGLIVRVLIVAVSLYVTAPFLAKLIRADDIESHHQRQVERYFAERDAAFQAQLAVRADALRTQYAGLLQPLEAEIARLDALLSVEQQRRAQIEAEYAPEIAVLRAELAAAQERLGDEIHGRDERPPGYGPEARRWDSRASSLVASLASNQAEIDRRIGEVTQTIADLEARLASRTDELQRLRLEQQERLEQVRAEVAAQQPEALPPRLTFAARSKALQDLRASPDEAGVPHFETVDGFAQAALAILFFSLMALKLFEPAAVRAYFTESLQLRYRQYLAGGLAGFPGFELPSDPALRLNPVEFARFWRHYEADPEGFFADRQTRLAAAEPAIEQQAGQSFAQSLLERRLNNLDLEAELASRRRAIELAAYEHEQQLRAAELRTRLAGETRAGQDQRRVEHELELQRARESWALEKAHAEEDLRERMAAFERSIELGREDRSLREKDLEIRRAQREEELRQTDVQRLHRHRVERTELEARRRSEERRERLARMHDELARLRELDSRESAEATRLLEAGYRLADGIGVLTEQIESIEAALASGRARQLDLTRIAESGPYAQDGDVQPTGGGFWSRAERSGPGKAAREAQRELKTLEKWLREEGERLVRLRDERRALQVRRMTTESQLREAQARVAAVQSRILFHEDAIGMLLAQEGPASNDIPFSDQAIHPSHPLVT